MSRLIDADALKDKRIWMTPFGADADAGRRAVLWTDISNAPTIDAEPVNHGRWIGDPDDYFDDLDDLDELQCSVCGAEFDNISNDVLGWNYCPNCGAKMDGGNDG